jgi:hypothetical protein
VASARGEVRIRQKGAKFFQTVKTGTGLKRREHEIELSKKQFRKLWPLTKNRRLEKIRYTLKQKGFTLELDGLQKEATRCQLDQSIDTVGSAVQIRTRLPLFSITYLTPPNLRPLPANLQNTLGFGSCSSKVSV